MQIPSEITFHALDHSDAVEAAVRRWIDRLERIHDRIIKCTVTIGQPHRRQRHGGEFHINVVIEVPGGEIVAAHLGHEDIYVAIADAFRAARRQLQHHVDVRRGFVKTHLVERTGNIGMNVAKHRTELDPEPTRAGDRARS